MLENKEKYFESMLKYLENEKLAVNLLFVTRDKASAAYRAYKGNLSDDIGTVLRKICLKIVKRSYKKPKERIFNRYNASQRYTDSSEYLDGTELEKIKPMLDMISNDVVDLKKINKNFLDGLWYYVILFDDGNKTMLFYKKYSKSMVLSKGLFLALAFKAGDFDKLNKDIFRIEEKADCIFFDNKLIIRSKGNFEKIFDFFEQIKKNAEAGIKFIEEKLPFSIENFNEIKSDWMNHEIKIRKLNNIFSTKILERIDSANIELLIKDGTLKNSTIKKDSEGKLILSSKDPWEILNILDDDYVKSRLTGINYQAPYKKETA